MIPAFLITFREALEAALIIAIMIAYLKKVGKIELNRYVWLGTGGAILASIVIGLIVLVTYGELKGTAEKLFEGIAAILATVVLTYMIFWMAKNAKKIKGELEEKIDVSITTGQILGISALAFIAVFREGVETVLFITAIALADPLGTVIGVIVGAAVVLGLAILLLKGSVRLPIKAFFKYTSILLVIFAAGLFGYGIHELIEVGEATGVNFGVLGKEAFNINPLKNSDGSYPLMHEKGAVGSILKALVGYDGNPEWLRVIGYLAYWIVVGLYLIKTYSPTLLARKVEG